MFAALVSDITLHLRWLKNVQTKLLLLRLARASLGPAIVNRSKGFLFSNVICQKCSELPRERFRECIYFALAEIFQMCAVNSICIQRVFDRNDRRHGNEIVELQYKRTVVRSFAVEAAETLISENVLQ